MSDEPAGVNQNSGAYGDLAGAGERKTAIALEYDHGTGQVPRVTARGEGEIAEQILKVARENGVPIEENPLLAVALSQVELDEEIPPELYKAVAEVIGFVLRRAGEI